MCCCCFPEGRFCKLHAHLHRARNGLLTHSVMYRYVAMHTMQETDVSGLVEETTGFGNGYLEGGGGHRRDSRQMKEGKSLRLVAAAVGGMLLPLITQVGHVH